VQLSAATAHVDWYLSRGKPRDSGAQLHHAGGAHAAAYAKKGCRWTVAPAENGPFKINDDLTLRDNPTGWDVNHNVIYVDQPIGTGYSYSDDPKDRVTSEKGTSNTTWESCVSPACKFCSTCAACNSSARCVWHSAPRRACRHLHAAETPTA
jgi:hypothetical protein